MTTWKEAVSLYREDKYEAQKIKERRDQIIKGLELIKMPRVMVPGQAHKLYEDFMKKS